MENNKSSKAKSIKQKATNKMETFKTILIWILSGIIVIAASYTYGMQVGSNSQKNLDAQVKAEAATLANKVVAAPESK